MYELLPVCPKPNAGYCDETLVHRPISKLFPPVGRVIALVFLRR